MTRSICQVVQSSIWTPWLLQVCLHLPLSPCELVCFCDASWLRLVRSFLNNSGQNKKQTEDKKLPFLNSGMLFYVYHSSICWHLNSDVHHCTSETKTGKLGEREIYFSKKIARTSNIFFKWNSSHMDIFVMLRLTDNSFYWPNILVISYCCWLNQTH